MAAIEPPGTRCRPRRRRAPTAAASGSAGSQAQGGLPGDPRAPRDGGFQTHGALVHLGVRITRLIYNSLPGVPVAGLLYQPEARRRGRAARQRPPGRRLRLRPPGTAKRAAEFQGVCLDLALHGLVVLAIDPWGQGERHQYRRPRHGGRPLVPTGTFEHSYSGLQCLLTGGGVCRYFAWDAVRAVDVLAALPEVDPARIGVTGNSGGGAQTTLLMLADERLAAAMPCTYITALPQLFRTGQTLDSELCFAASLAAGIDHADLLAGFAPRPLLVGAAAYDFFPVEGDRARLPRRPAGSTPSRAPPSASGWSWAGTSTPSAPTCARRRCASSPASWRARSATSAARSRPCRRRTWCAAPPARSTCDRPDGRGIYHLNRDFLAAHRRTPPASAPEAAARLRAGAGPHAGARRHPHPPPLLRAAPRAAGESATGVSTQQVYFWSQPGVAVAGTLLRPAPAARRPARRPGWCCCPTARRSPVARPGRRPRSGPRRRAGARLRPPRARGGRARCRSPTTPPTTPSQGPEAWFNYVEILIGHSTLASRVYDVRRAVSFLEQFEGAGGPGGHPRPRASRRCGATSPPRWTSASAPPT